jgi:hypothetical protein
MTPDQAVTLLSGDWPPRVEHWPPKDKNAWKPGMRLVGRIEAVLTLPRPEGSKKRGEPYTALYVRREGDGRLIMWHGWHTAAEDVDSMHPAPGLLFTCVYRGEEDNGFENFKYLVTPYDAPAERPAAPQAEVPAGGFQPTAVRAAQAEASAQRRQLDQAHEAAGINLHGLRPAQALRVLRAAGFQVASTTAMLALKGDDARRASDQCREAAEQYAAERRAG